MCCNVGTRNSAIPRDTTQIFVLKVCPHGEKVGYKVDCKMRPLSSGLDTKGEDTIRLSKAL